MRMIVCTGSERPIRKVMFNRDGDLLFAASVDKVITLWNPDTGERMGTYNGHRGAVTDICVDYMSKYLISGGGDGTMRIWNVCNGEQVFQFIPSEKQNLVQSVEFSCGDQMILATTPQRIQETSRVHIYKNPMLMTHEEKNDLNFDEEEYEDSKTDDEQRKMTERFKIQEMEIKNPSEVKNFKPSKTMWSPTNKEIYAACSDGTIRVFDVNRGIQTRSVVFDPDFSKKLKADNKASPEVTDMQYCNKYSCLVATSRNTEARMFDLRSWECIKLYKTNRGLNTVAVHPIVDGIAIGGGKTAQQAALDRSSGNYDIILEHMVFEDKVGIIDPECFSPLNTMAFNEDGSLFVLGYEEGTVRIFKMDANFDDKWDKIAEKFTSNDMDDDDDDDDE